MDMSDALSNIEIDSLQDYLCAPANTTVNAYLCQKSPHYSTDALWTMAQ
jgi:hypothetical protein